MDDYGSLVLMPQTGPLVIGAMHRASVHRLADSGCGPHHLKLDLLRYRITLEMVPTERGAMFVLRFPAL